MADELNERLQSYLEKPIVCRALEKLEQQLSSEYVYHTAVHTKNVMLEALRFGTHDNLSERELELLMIAAAYHDTGFLELPVDNESVGARFAREAMRGLGGFSEEEVELVSTMILDTRVISTRRGPEQIASSTLAGYLLDADVSNLGRADFFERTELLRKEMGVERDLFLRQVHRFLENHKWLTPAGNKLRADAQQENYRVLSEILQELHQNGEPPEDEGGMNLERLHFLAKLPLLINSSLELKQVARSALEHMKGMLNAEAATVFLLDESESELSFWALKGGEENRLEGKKMPASKGIVGWVIERQESVLSNDVGADPRFFDRIDREGGFHTRNLMCIPLTLRGEKHMGALQILNKQHGGDFYPPDLQFVEQFGHQLCVAIENARLYESIRQKSLKLATLERRKNEMITVIAHEFRTPLNVIQASADMLSPEFEIDQDTRAKLAETLLSGVQRLTRLVSQIGSLTHVSGGELPLQKGELNVRELLERVAAQFEEPLAKRELTLHLEIAPGVDNAFADPALVSVVMSNLISNAIRFTSNGGVITLKAEESSGFVTIVVQDSGIGIEESQLPMIFEKFYEVGDAMEHSSGEYEFKSGGLGLGLATAKDILRQHGSSLDVDSKLGEGSSFTFRLAVEE